MPAIVRGFLSAEPGGVGADWSVAEVMDGLDGEVGDVGDQLGSAAAQGAEAFGDLVGGVAFAGLAVMGEEGDADVVGFGLDGGFGQVQGVDVGEFDFNHDSVKGVARCRRCYG